MAQPTQKPRLTDRVLRGILTIEDCCGGLMPEIVGEHVTQKEWDDAQAALEWARRMRAWKRERF